MKAKKFIQDNSAVSEVLGVVLIIGILVAAFSIVISISLPQWTKSFEAAHAGEVVDELSELASQVDSVVLVAKQGGDIAAGTTAITMKPDRVPVIGMSPPGSSLEFRRDEDRFYITPHVSGEPAQPPGEACFWEETTTDNFSHTNATRVNVDVALDTIRLAAMESSGDLILNNTVTSLSGECQYNKVELTNSSTINLVFGNYLRIYANTIYIDATSRINADELGCFGGDGGKSGTGTGAGERAYNGSGGGGAGHNGTGGDGGNGGISKDLAIDEFGAGGISYGGNASFLLDFGSGGGGGAYGEGGQGAPHQGQVGGDGGHGGGAVFLDAAQIIIFGNISANGADGAPGFGATLASGGGGGGSGGTITIRGYDINISFATLLAKGGAGGAGGDQTGGGNPKAGGGGGGGGAGGRIKIFYDNESRYNASFSGDECAGGAGGAGGHDNQDPGDSGAPGNDSAPYENQTTYIASVPHYTFGYYESRVFDTGNTTTCYDKITWNGYTTEYTSITVKVRTSIYEEMEGNATLWANCDAVASGPNLTDLNSVFDWHQYIQYRVELSTYDEMMTPVFYGANITYYTSDPAGGFPVIAESTGMVKFKSGHIYYPKQEIAYEHGAVIKCQRETGEEEGIVIQPPPILISNESESGIPTIEISMINLTGTNDSYSGTTAMSVKNSYVEYDSISTKFHNLSLNISTEYPTIWGKWFNDTLAESGLNESRYEVYETGDYVVVDLYGDEQHVHLVAVDKTEVGVALAT